MIFFLPPLPLFFLSAPILLPHSHMCQSCFSLWIGDPEFQHTWLQEPCVWVCVPSPKPQPAWRPPGDFKACSFLEGQGLKLLLFSLHDPQSLQCQVQRRGNISLFPQTTKLRRSLSVTAAERQSWAALEWQGPFVPAPLWPLTLLLCLLPRSGNKAQEPLQARCLPFRNPGGGGKRTGSGHPGLACPLSKEMQLDFELTFRLSQAKRERVTELLTAILLHLQIVWVAFYWNAALGRFWVWLQGEVEGLWLLQHVNPLLPASPAVLCWAEPNAGVQLQPVSPQRCHAMWS